LLRRHQNGARPAAAAAKEPTTAWAGLLDNVGQRVGKVACSAVCVDDPVLVELGFDSQIYNR
jgi:hypothetical protein